MSFNPNQPDVIVADKEEQKVDEPPKWKVVMHNDDFTPMDFVVDMLKQYFGHTMESATLIMLDVHEKGKGIAGVFGSRDIAETKVAQALYIAKKNDHPFLMTLEKE